MKRLWIPDGEPINVEWYISKSRAVGVEKISDDWVRHDVGDSALLGFWVDRASQSRAERKKLEACWDPERDLPEA